MIDLFPFSSFSISTLQNYEMSAATEQYKEAIEY